LKSFGTESERLELPAPFSRRIAESLDADAAGEVAPSASRRECTDAGRSMMRADRQVLAFEHYADASLLAPNNAAPQFGRLNFQHQGKDIWDSNRADYIECRARVREITNGTAYTTAAERYRSGFQYPMPRRLPSLVHGFHLCVKIPQQHFTSS
jgi:hypothetical protein